LKSLHFLDFDNGCAIHQNQPIPEKAWDERLIDSSHSPSLLLLLLLLCCAALISSASLIWTDVDFL
jgi:hypothetical protein